MNLSKLDLQIELSPSQLLQIDGWLAEFYSKCKSRMSDPIIESSCLKIGSADIYNFLSAINVTDENKLDWYRLKQRSCFILKSTYLRKKNSMVIQHYKDCEHTLFCLKSKCGR